MLKHLFITNDELFITMTDQQIIECAIKDNKNDNKQPIDFDNQDNEKEVKLISHKEVTLTGAPLNSIIF